MFEDFLPTETYCTAGTSASGCQALLSAVRDGERHGSRGFSLSAGTVEGQKDGLFFFGTNGRQANSWGNGTSFLCVVPPTQAREHLDGLGTSAVRRGLR